MATSYLLSVVIPTRNRESYAEASIRHALAVTSKDVEVVVQDNSDAPDLGRALKDLKSVEPRLSYEYSAEELSFSANFDRAVSRSRGEYVCIIGDDDAVLPIIEETVKCARTYELDAISPVLPAVYYWPGSMPPERAHLNACLVVQDAPRGAVIGDPRPVVRKLLARGAVDYLTLPLVKSYHGVVRRELLEKVHARTGRYFAGLSPDIYSSVSLSFLATNVLVTDWPITLPGVCAASGSADSATGRHTGKLAEAPHFRGNSEYDWSAQVPPVYSVETIWAESALAARNDMGFSDVPFGDAALRWVIRYRHPTLRSEVSRPVGFAGLRVAVSVLAKNAVHRASARAKRLAQKPLVVDALPDIELAARALSQAQEARGITIDAVEARIASARRDK